jgi:hypothetical protein
VKKEELQWSAKYAAIFAVRQLLMGDIRNCEIFFEMHGVVSKLYPQNIACFLFLIFLFVLNMGTFV